MFQEELDRKAAQRRSRIDADLDAEDSEQKAVSTMPIAVPFSFVVSCVPKDSVP